MAARITTIVAAIAALAEANPGGYGNGPVVSVNTNQKYQVYDGIGVSEAFQRSLVIHELDTPSQTKVLDYLFSKTKGIGMTILRNGLGSSPDQPFDLMKSIAPTAPRSNSSQLNFIPLPREDQYQVWLSYQAISRGVDTIYADAWSADGYMKTNNTENYGGYLCGVTGTNCASGDWRQSYANKIVKYIQDYEALGIKVKYVGFLNEPDLNTTYASMQSDGRQAADFIEVLYPTLKRAGLKTQIACCDGSGWEQNRERLTGIQQAGDEDKLGLVTAHGYSSKPGAPFNTSKHVWQTEWSSFDPINYKWYTKENYQSDGLTWANYVQQGFSRSNMNGFLYWWGAANTTDNQSLLFINNTSEVKVTKRLWAFAHFGSRFVRVGANRVSASVAGGDGLLNVTAFANTDGSRAVQVINNGNNTETVTLQGVQYHGKVTTVLTNEANDLTYGVARNQRGAVSAVVPGKSLLSFYIESNGHGW
ncbi:hypothetical protein LTR95_011814 [Oleoguttula sp. CCFEE 5521]|uniref:Uncharacterized protein n=1 Tax=Cryoendolithus antarcticus TaxID=1507870 RepID=A0A1V8TP35_9PEZI|nr:hypothetical protein B0A48_02436 [Cryoendolithus antarcticus]